MSVAEIMSKLEEQIAFHTDACDRARQLIYLLKSVSGGDEIVAAPEAKGRGGRGKRPAAGSLPGRILDIVGESDDDAVTMAQIMAANPGANLNAVRYQASKLTKAGWLVATGSTSNRRYSLPLKRGKRAR